MTKTLIVIPAYNEAENIGAVLESLLAEKIDADVLVINDGSVDATEQVIRRFPVTVLTHPCNMGYGMTLKTGYKYALMMQYDYVIQFDADGQHSPRDVVNLIREIDMSGADLTIGSRFVGNVEFRPGVIKWLAIRWFRLLIFLFTHHRISDPTSGLRGLSRPLMQYYAASVYFPVDFPDADFVTDVLMHRWKVEEVPVGSHERQAGKSMHSGLKPLIYLGKVTLSTVAVALHHLVAKRGMTS